MRLRTIALLAAAAFTAATHAFAGTYPDKPIQLIVAYPPGGGTDILARIVAAEMGKSLGQTVVVINRAGASGAIGTEAAARATPDGYTLLMATGNVTITPAVDPHARFDATRDFAPVTLLSEAPFVLVATPALHVHSVPELLAWSRAHPGKVNFASTGPGSPQQLAGEALKKAAGLDWVHVPYQGGAPALASLEAGDVQVMFSNLLPVRGALDAGKLVALGVAHRDRLPALPQVPTLKEQGQGDFSFGFWTGVLAPAGTPAPVVARLNDCLMKIVQSPAVRERLEREGALVTPLPAAQFTGYIADDAARWKRIVQATGARLD